MADLITRLTVDNANLFSGLNKARAETDKFAKHVQERFNTSVGGGFGGIDMAKFKEIEGHFGEGFLSKAKGISTAFIGIMSTAAAIGAKMFVSAVEEGGHIQDMSDRLGLPPEEVQRLTTAGALVGVSIEQIAGAFKKLGVAQGNALDGSKEQKEAFEELGISMDDLQKSDPSQLFAKISENLQGAQPNARQLAALVKVTGKSADELLPLLKADVGENFATASGGAISELDQLGDSWTMLKNSIKAAGLEVASYFATTINGITRFMGLTKELPGQKYGAAPEAANIVRQIQEKQRAEKDKEKKDFEEDKKASKEYGKHLDTLGGETAEKLATTQEEAKLAAMTPEQKKEFFKKKVRDATADITTLETDFKANIDRVNNTVDNPDLSDEENKLGREQEQQELQRDRININAKKIEKAEAEKSLAELEKSDLKKEPKVMDQLAAVGGLTEFGSFNEQLELERQSTDYLRTANEYLRQLAAEAKNEGF